MNSDSDDEISHLRAAALSTRPSNMRKRKVTLINSRNVVTGESNVDKRKIFVNPRKVVIGANSCSSKQSQENSATTSDNDNDSDSNWPRAVMHSYAPKKPKLQNDHKTLSTSEKQVKTRKDQRIFTASKEKRSKKFAPDEDIDFDKDVRIILDDDNEDGAGVKDNGSEGNTEIDDEDELEIMKNKIVDVDDGVSNDETEDVTVTEERLSLRKIEITSSGQRTEGEDIDEVEEGDQSIQDILEGEKEDETQDEHLEEEQQESEEEKRKVGEEEKHTKNVKEVEEVKSGIEKKLKDNENLNVVTHGDSVEAASKKDENKPSKTEKNKSSETRKGKSTKKKTEMTNVAQRDKNSAGNTSDDESSGSDSDSSDSSDSSSSSGSSSSSYSGTSSSSRSSNGSRSSSGSDSDSNDDKKSKDSKNSSRHSSDSSSYSYSTGGSAEKNTMRSVISHKDSRRSRSPQRSPRGRWSPRDRRYSDKHQSYDRDDSYRRNVNRKDRVRSSRDKSPRFVRRRSPHSRLGRRPSSPRDYRKDRKRSRERNRPRDLRRPNERPRPRRTRSKSVEDKNHSSDKNNLSRTDNVDQKRHVKESRLKKSGRLGERRVNANVRGPCFDLRSRLGPKKSETNLIITKKIDSGQNLIQRQVTEIAKEDKIEVEGYEKYVDDEEQNGEDYDNYDTSPSLSGKPRGNLLQEDKEAELDAKILRIEKMNEEIRKRQEEIEREKMLYS